MSFVHISEVIDQILTEMDSDKPCRFIFNPIERGDSVLERRFWHMLRKTEGAWHGAIDQFQIGKFRVDCLIDCDGKAVVIELDGKAYHDAMADELRDAELLKSVDAIIRIPFAAMWYYRYGTFKILGEWFPRLALRTDYNTVISVADFKEEFQAAYECRDNDWNDYVEAAEHSYDVWERDGDMALVGSPSAFQYSTKKMHRVWVQRGRRDPSILEHLYKQADCRNLHNEVQI
jgi:hypothetical protein